MIEWSLFTESWPAYASGLWLTLQLTALALIAGLVNATGYLGFRHESISNMTGNTSLLGIALHIRIEGGIDRETRTVNGLRIKLGFEQ